MKSLMAALTAAFFVSGSWAALGSAPGIGVARAVAPKLSSSSPGAAAYTVVQRQLDTGTTVQEFVDSRGMVFAVSWSGPFLPDLKDLLGVHFDSMVAKGQGKGTQRSRLMVKDPGVVIVSEGHMGAFEGRAWVPSRLPAGFDVREMP